MCLRPGTAAATTSWFKGKLQSTTLASGSVKYKEYAGEYAFQWRSITVAKQQARRVFKMMNNEFNDYGPVAEFFDAAGNCLFRWNPRQRRRTIERNSKFDNVWGKKSETGGGWPFNMTVLGHSKSSNWTQGSH